MPALDVRIGRAGLGKMRRIVVRLDVATLGHVDALRRTRWPSAKRAAVLRALIVRGLDASGTPALVHVHAAELDAKIEKGGA